MYDSPAQVALPQLRLCLYQVRVGFTKQTAQQPYDTFTLCDLIDL